ncbi:uncharacterized protein LOC109712638 [Ananas comosus]|uniref:Uncharacterized protein LOC109712638 n=1 Tax=Ananas comosus TaxID=4615 RepID=A0A6P5F8I8_ANACO|nr:uncharacterized protein LOC109712638 [Ananas comosus]
MELFQRAKAVRLKSHHDKYLFADDDELRVTQDRDGASPNARWAVEHVPVPSVDGGGGEGHRVFRLRSRYGKYLTASNEPFLLGMTGRKVLQTKPERLDSAVEWEPEREGFQVRLKTRYGHYLRANGGLPPWRNSVTHDVPHRTATQDWVLWDVEILEINLPSPASSPSPAVVAAAPSSSPNPPPQAKLSKLESSDSFATPLHKVDSRVIYYHIADDKGRVDDGIEGHSFIFNGTSLEELTHKLEEETGLSDIIVCSKSPLNGKLHPLRLQLPPNNAAMHIVLVRENSKVAKTFP